MQAMTDTTRPTPSQASDQAPSNAPRILLVTGASRGIGAATARMAARAGWDVAVNYTRDATAAQAVAQEVRALGRRALVVQADVADEAQVLAMFEAVDAGLGRLSGLVNNAGVVDMPARVDEMTVTRLQRMVVPLLDSRRIMTIHRSEARPAPGRPASLSDRPDAARR